MSKKLPTVIVTIPWWYTTEQVRLDLASLSHEPKQVITTNERWEEGTLVTYRPHATYMKAMHGDHVVNLDYRLDDHPHLEGRGIRWGVTTITVNKEISRLTVEWKGRPTIKGEDCCFDLKFSIEQPSAKGTTVVQVRTAQARFKKALLELGEQCAITKVSIVPLLDAAHIQEVKDGGSDVPWNGILLRTDLHRLYDAGYFTIESDGRLTLHEALPPDYAKLLKGKRLSQDVVARVGDYLKKRKQPKLS